MTEWPFHYDFKESGKAVAGCMISELALMQTQFIEQI